VIAGKYSRLRYWRRTNLVNGLSRIFRGIAGASAKAALWKIDTLCYSSSLRKNLEIEVFLSLEGHCFWCVRSLEALFGGLNSHLPTLQRGVTLDFSRPGKPTDNAFIEAFNGRFRAGCLNAQWFLSLADARERWRIGASTTMRNALTGRSAKRRRLCC
jgi:hypothetical protein